MKQDEWSGFVKKIKKLMEVDPNRGEADTRAKIVEPLLEQLGWSFVEDEVKVEYSIKFGTATSRVDYALLIDERPTVFVEAKALGSDLTSDDARQILDYGRHKGIEWCVLTNGKEVEIYNTKWGEDPKQALVDKVTLQEFIDKKHILEKISKYSIKSGETRKYADTIKQVKEGIERINRDREAVEGDISNILKNRTGEILHEKIESLSKKFIADVIQELKGFAQGIGAEPPKIKIPVVRMEDLIRQYPDGSLVVTTSRPGGKTEEGLPSGEDFLRQFNAWGFITVKRKPQYFALYISKPESKVKYFAKVKDIIDPLDFKSPLKDIETPPDSWSYEEGKKLILFEEGSIVEIRPPIEFGKKMMLGLRYTTLKKFVEARTTDDLTT